MKIRIVQKGVFFVVFFMTNLYKLPHSKIKLSDLKF